MVLIIVHSIIFIIYVILVAKAKNKIRNSSNNYMCSSRAGVKTWVSNTNETTNKVGSTTKKASF